MAQTVNKKGTFVDYKSILHTLEVTGTCDTCRAPDPILGDSSDILKLLALSDRVYLPF